MALTGITSPFPSLLTHSVPLQAISLDFLGVPGSEVASKTADLIEKHGFPEGKRLGAGVVDGRSVWADGETPAALIAALQAKVSCLQSYTWHRFGQQLHFYFDSMLN